MEPQTMRRAIDILVSAAWFIAMEFVRANIGTHTGTRLAGKATDLLHAMFANIAMTAVSAFVLCIVLGSLLRWIKPIIPVSLYVLFRLVVILALFATHAISPIWHFEVLRMAALIAGCLGGLKLGRKISKRYLGEDEKT
jgi:hypothetical protein